MKRADTINGTVYVVQPPRRSGQVTPIVPHKPWLQSVTQIDEPTGMYSGFFVWTVKSGVQYIYLYGPWALTDPTGGDIFNRVAYIAPENWTLWTGGYAWNYDARATLYAKIPA